jgi:cation:H+ antiporter
MIYLYLGVLLAAFVVLFKSADYFVRGASGIAEVLNIPKIVVGIVFVGLATTAPEFGVSVISAIMGHPEIALGNAVGSVIADDGIALPLAAFVAPGVILVNCRILKAAGVFLLGIDYLAYFLARNGRISRGEGLIFVSILVIYFIFMLRGRKNHFGCEAPEEEDSRERRKTGCRELWPLLKKPVFLFSLGIIGVVLSSRFGIIWASIRIAEYFSVSETIIGLTIIAIGTSLPEISTCITAALKGEGEIAVGDIIGADILNVLWIIGVSSIFKPIQVERDIINFSFPFMILIVTVMLVSMRLGCRMNKFKGLILFCLYILYFVLTLVLFT